MTKIYLSIAMLFAFFNGPCQEEINKIPVVFHVLYARNLPDNGINFNAWNEGNSSQNVPTFKLIEELKTLQNDFLLLNTDTTEINENFKSIIGNARIEFFLADTILQVGGERGINRVHTKRNKHRVYKRNKIIHPERYLNIYIGKFPNSFVVSGAPWLVNESDAVFIDYRWVGQGYRLLSHEVGHWLGLPHIFGGDGTGKGGDCQHGDEINDTPPQKGPTDPDCQKCPPKIDQKLCDDSINTNYNNFMDYSGCRRMFTKEQVAKMRLNIKLYRKQLR